MLRWIALHEVTHAVHFGAAPWLREHLRGLAGELIDGQPDRRRPCRYRARRPRDRNDRSAPAGVRALEQRPADAAEPPESRCADREDPGGDGGDRGLCRTRNGRCRAGARGGHRGAALWHRAPPRGRPPLARLLAWLLGMELKLRQYRDGKRFCDGVVELDGIATLNEAWATRAACRRWPSSPIPAAGFAATASARGLTVSALQAIPRRSVAGVTDGSVTRRTAPG